MRLLALVSVVIGAFLPAPAGFDKVVGGPDLDRGIFAAPTRDGGYAVIGYTKSFGQGDADVYLVRTDASGAVLWTRTYGGPAEDNGWSVLEVGASLVLAGYTRSFGNGGYDCYLIKTDGDGETEWSRTFGGEDDDRCWALLPSNDGGYLLVGETTSSGKGAEDCFLIRTDASGREVWSRTFGGEKGDRCFSGAKTHDGGVLLAGQTYSTGAGDRDVYLVKTDASGNESWSRTFGGTGSDVGHSVAPTTDGGFLVTGYTGSFDTQGDDPYLVKIDSGGQTQWTRVIPMDGVNHTLTGEQATDGGFILGGFSIYRSRGDSALIVKTDSEGNLEWFKDILRTATRRSFGYTVRATSDGGCILTGHTTTDGNLDLFLVKVDSQGRR